MNNTTTNNEGAFAGGLQALTKSLRYAFFILLTGVILTLIYFLTLGGYFSVEPQQAVIVLRFGKAEQVYFTGAHWFTPYPVHRFIRVRTNQQFAHVDFLPAKQVSKDQEPSLIPGRDNYLLTGDANIVHASWRFAYHIVDPLRYYKTLTTPAQPVVNGQAVDDDEIIDADGFSGTRGPITLLKNLFTETVIEVTSTRRCDDILSRGISAYRDEVMREFAAKVAALDCGIDIDDVTLNRIYPPARTKEAFDAVTSAGNTRSMLRNEALAYRVSVQNDTLAKEAEILSEAVVYCRRNIAKIKSECEYFMEISKEYAKNPSATYMALYSAALRDALQETDNDRFLLGTDPKQREVRLLMNPEPKRNEEKTEKSEEDKKE